MAYPKIFETWRVRNAKTFLIEGRFGIVYKRLHHPFPQCKTFSSLDVVENAKVTHMLSSFFRLLFTGWGIMSRTWVGLTFGYSTVCLILLGLMGKWQNWLSSWARWVEQIKVNPGPRPDASPCILVCNCMESPKWVDCDLKATQPRLACVNSLALRMWEELQNSNLIRNRASQ